MTSKNKSFFIKKIAKFIGYSWKWFLLATYLGIATWGWNRKNYVLNLIPNHKNTFIFSVYQALISVLFLLIFLLFLIGIVQWIRTPIYLRWKFQRGFNRIGFKNSVGEIPILLSYHKDKNKKYGVIYTFKSVGLSAVDFDSKVHQIQTVVNGSVYEIAYSKKSMNRILLSILPQKYNTPKIIAPDNATLCQEPNLLCVGKTGSGKSCALATLLGKYALHIPGVSITICDYKKSSFAQFEGTPNFYGYEDVPDGIRKFYKEFRERLAANDEQRNEQVKVLLIDEYGVLISAQEKKVAEELKTMVGNLLFMGRSLNMRVLIGLQRADAGYFRAGARDQFRAILALGNISKEQKQMLFSDYKEKMTEENSVGEGYLLIDGQDIERVKIAPITDLVKLNENIRKAMYH